MNGKRAKRLRRGSYVVTPTGHIVHPSHPGRKHGGTVGADAGSLGLAAARLTDELARRAKEMKAPEITP